MHFSKQSDGDLISVNLHVNPKYDEIDRLINEVWWTIANLKTSHQGNGKVINDRCLTKIGQSVFIIQIKYGLIKSAYKIQKY